jgi:hypothetical protein
MMFDMARTAKRENVGWIAYTVWCRITRHNVVHVLAGKAAVSTVGMLLDPSFPERAPMTETQVRRLNHLEPMHELWLAIKDGKQ